MADVSGTMNPEIPLVGGEHAMDTLTFRDAHDGRVGEVHRQVVIFRHQLAHAWDQSSRSRCDFDDSACEKSHQSRLSAQHRFEDMTGFSYRGPDR